MNNSHFGWLLGPATVRVAIPLMAMMMVSECLGQSSPNSKRIVGYYPLWRMTESPLTDLPLQRLTHLNLAFAHLGTLGDCRLSEDIPETDYRRRLKSTLATIRGAHPQLKVLVSVGGWKRSRRFSDVAANSRQRAVFVDTCVQIVEELKLDGVDIDWEFPVARWPNDNAGRPEDRQNLVVLLAELNKALGNGDRILTCSISAAPFHLDHLDLPAIRPHVGWLNVMTYDQWGSWADRTGLHAPLGSPKVVSQPKANAIAHIEALLKRGVPAEKIVLGVPFYGRGVVRVPETDFGMNKTHGGPARGTTENELFAYADLVENYFPTIPAYWDDAASAGWLYNADNGLMISFEDVRSVTAKANYVREQGLGGVAIWEVTMDTNGPRSLLKTISDIFQN